MYIRHELGDDIIEREGARDPQALLTNTRGAFFVWQDRPQTHYHGLFFREGDELFTIFSHIKLSIDIAARRIVNRLWNFSIDRDSAITERFFLHPDDPVLLYELNTPVWFSVFADGKKIFDNDEWGREYDVAQEGELVVVSYTKRKELGIEYRLFLVVASDGPMEHVVRKEWVRHEYSRDFERRDPPFERYVFRALDVKGRRFAFASGTDKEAVKRAAVRALVYADHLQYAHARTAREFVKQQDSVSEDKALHAAALCARWSLQGMVMRDQHAVALGMYAGIPWLAQFWFRDFALCAPALNQKDAYAIFARALEAFQASGSLTPCLGLACVPYADTTLLFFKLAADFKKAGMLSDNEIAQCASLIERYIAEDLPRAIKDGFVHNNTKETWMDTEFRGSGRQGSRVEIQALTARLFASAFVLTGDKKYVERERAFARTIREAFWNGSFLRDGIGDDTVRPNMFLAFHVYPRLLLKHEWRSSFKRALDVLWRSWGGLATIPKDHALFCGTHRGCEDPNQSYHHGDSWFYINNLAARALRETDPVEFAPFIEAILQKSADDILWNGMIGHHTELSSAERYEPGGCFTQAWSAAFFVDAVGVPPNDL